jgi:hypothetical protein
LKGIQRLKYLLAGREVVHLMHIPKTAGTAIKAALKGKEITRHYTISIHEHAWTLRDLPHGQRVMFFVRDPLARYTSGFYSRLRQGRPRYDFPWSLGEKIAFEKFAHPSDLAEALTSDNPELNACAKQAMRDIVHVNASLSQWLVSPEYLESKSDQILFIGFQEQLNTDFQKFKRYLELPHEVILPTNDIAAHRTPPEMDQTLTVLAKRNLETWYKADIILYELCKKIYAERFE